MYDEVLEVALSSGAFRELISAGSRRMWELTHTSLRDWTTSVSNQVLLGPSGTEGPTFSPWTAVAREYNQIAEIDQRLARLEERIAALASWVPDEQIIVLRFIDRDEARLEIEDLFATGETLFYSDIAARLRLDLPIVVEICQELEEQGSIEEA